MFSSGEFIVIGLVALIVIGPERLPKVARMAGHLLGRMQRYVNTVKADINREMQLDEMKKLEREVADQVLSVEQSIGQEVKAVDEHLKSVETSLNQSLVDGVAAKAAAESPAAPLQPGAPAVPAPAPSALPAETTAEKPKS